MRAMIRSVEFMLDALDDLDDLPAIAKQLTARADEGRIACGQPDPGLWELVIGEKRLLYRQEDDEVIVLHAEHMPPTQH